MMPPTGTAGPTPSKSAVDHDIENNRPNLKPTPRGPQQLRIRADSAGSTRGAFGPMPDSKPKKKQQQLQADHPALPPSSILDTSAQSTAKRKKNRGLKGKHHPNAPSEPSPFSPPTQPRNGSRGNSMAGPGGLAEAASVALSLEMGSSDINASLEYDAEVPSRAAKAKTDKLLKHTPLPPHPMSVANTTNDVFRRRKPPSSSGASYEVFDAISPVVSGDMVEEPPSHSKLDFSPARTKLARQGLAHGDSTRFSLSRGYFDSLNYSEENINKYLSPPTTNTVVGSHSGGSVPGSNPLLGSGILDNHSPPSRTQTEDGGKFSGRSSGSSEISSFAAMVKASASDYGALASPPPIFQPPRIPELETQPRPYSSILESYQSRVAKLSNSHNDNNDDQDGNYGILPNHLPPRHAPRNEEIHMQKVPISQEPHPLLRPTPQRGHHHNSREFFLDDNGMQFFYEPQPVRSPCEIIGDYLNPRHLLGPETYYDEDGNPFMEEEIGVVASALRKLFFNPDNPEFTSLQQFSWACIIGIFMGILTAKWGEVIEFCVDIMWKEVPRQLYEWGVFTDLDGAFPLPHYMWICPGIFGGVLSWITVSLPKPIPGQNEWIQSLHSRGVQDHDTFLTIILVSTAGMASGLSLGPELPLVLASGMVGSYFGLITEQSVLSARVMNLTAGSAAIGGFFGFPMAGALFVLELPHRMGLQYFEALSPATISSIIAVLVNRIVTGNDVTGYFKYPFLSASLPSHIFYIAILYGLVGSIVGIFYAKVVIWLKVKVHDLFHYHEHTDDHHTDESPEQHYHENTHESTPSETLPLVGKSGFILKTRRPCCCARISSCLKRMCSFGIQHEPTRAAVAGTIAGVANGVICMFVPHCLFWGEAQLQTLIDKGRTPLPIFGMGDDPTADLTAYGYCLINPEDANAVAAGFSLSCSAIICVTKILTVGLSLGTGIVGGQFWGPLFVGAAASHLFTDLMIKLTNHFGFGQILSTYPCLAILCIMGSTHVVTFRAHMAIMLILTLTISAFSSGEEDGSGGGDYSAVFPLLVVSCFVSLMLTRDTIFYKEQRCRGDIIASPEVLCEPGKHGQPIVVGYDEEDDDDDEFYDDDDDDDDVSWGESTDAFGTERDSERTSMSIPRGTTPPMVETDLTQNDIERAFMEKALHVSQGDPDSPIATSSGNPSMEGSRPPRSNSRETASPSPRSSSTAGSLKPRIITELQPPSRLDELLAMPQEESALSAARRKISQHRRSSSDIVSRPVSSQPTAQSRERSSSFDKGQSHRRKPSIDANGNGNVNQSTRSRNNTSSSRSGTPTQGILTRVSSFGEIVEFQPSLLHQARKRASSVNRPAVPKMFSRRHSRNNSLSSSKSAHGSSGVSIGEIAGSLSQDDVERSMGPAVPKQNPINGGTLSKGGSRRRLLPNQP